MERVKKSWHIIESMGKDDPTGRQSCIYKNVEQIYHSLEVPVSTTQKISQDHHWQIKKNR